MPGVRFRMPEQRIPWPDLGILGAGSSGIGTADYTATRKAIVNRYAIPWLLKIHDQNKSLYANCLYQQCLQLADASSISSLEHKEHGSGEQCAVSRFYCLRINLLIMQFSQHEVEMADETLKYIVKLCQWGIVWTTFDDLFMNWLDTMSKLSRFSTVCRLFTPKYSCIDNMTARSIQKSASAVQLRRLQKIHSRRLC